MKRFLKCFSCYLVAVLIIASCVCFPSLGVSAASFPSGFLVDDFRLVRYFYEEGVDEEGNFNLDEVPVNYDVYIYNFYASPGTYVIYGRPAYVFAEPTFDYVLLDLSNGEGHTGFFGDPFTIPESVGEYGWLLLVQSVSDDFSIENYPTSKPLYESAWDLFVSFIYGENAQLTPEQNLTLTILATLAALLVVIFPFALVYFILKFIFGWR